MNHDAGALSSALAAAVGDDAALKAELRVAFIESGERLADMLARSRCDANWHGAALRLKGLAASFGAVGLMQAADDAAAAAPGDPVALRQVKVALAAIQLGD
ncbi:MAG: Hpt domain-containing protein [Sphingomonadaceae bacterium]|nr:Hpt domain-containing protein [Sphingomonadaceae bacterium]